MNILIRSLHFTLCLLIACSGLAQERISINDQKTVYQDLKPLKAEDVREPENNSQKVLSFQKSLSEDLSSDNSIPSLEEQQSLEQYQQERQIPKQESEGIELSTQAFVQDGALRAYLNLCLNYFRRNRPGSQLEFAVPFCINFEQSGDKKFGEYRTDDRIDTQAMGLSLIALCVAINQNLINRSTGLSRIVQILQFLQKAQFNERDRGQSGASGPFLNANGFFLNFYSFDLFIEEDPNIQDPLEGIPAAHPDAIFSTITTGYVLAGTLAAENFVGNAQDNLSRQIRNISQELRENVNWSAALFAGQLIAGWNQQGQALNNQVLRGYGEVFPVVLLSLAFLESSDANTVWNNYRNSFANQTRTVTNIEVLQEDGSSEVHSGATYIEPPKGLFEHQLIHSVVNLKNIQENSTRSNPRDFFKNTVQASYGNRQFAQNLAKLGSSASADNTTYELGLWATSRLFLGSENNKRLSFLAPFTAAGQNGFIAPSAAMSSFIFAQNESEKFFSDIFFQLEAPGRIQPNEYRFGYPSAIRYSQRASGFAVSLVNLYSGLDKALEMIMIGRSLNPSFMDTLLLSRANPTWSLALNRAGITQSNSTNYNNPLQTVGSSTGEVIEPDRDDPNFVDPENERPAPTAPDEEPEPFPGESFINTPEGGLIVGLAVGIPFGSAVGAAIGATLFAPTIALPVVGIVSSVAAIGIAGGLIGGLIGGLGGLLSGLS